LKNVFFFEEHHKGDFKEEKEDKDAVEYLPINVAN
jgi:hypothetical protein